MSDYDVQPASNPKRDPLSLFMALAASLLAVIWVAALYFGRDVFVPLALAVLLSFVLAPLVRLLQRIGAPRGLAIACVVMVTFSGILVLGGIVIGQVAELADDLPRYQSTMREKIRSIRVATLDGGALGRAADLLQGLSRELDTPPSRAPVTEAAGAVGDPIEEQTGRARQQDERPLTVEVRKPERGPLGTLGALLVPLLHPLATAGLIVIFVVFFLFAREDLRNRLIRLAGAKDLQKTTAAIDDAAHRLSRLFLTQLAVNATFGCVIGLGLWLIGVPSPILWGILAGILRFVPYVGAILGAAFPLAVAIAIDPGWSMMLWTMALFLAVEPILGHVIEPMIYGHSTGLSPVAVVVAATFWTFLWGPIGLVLATPLTVCLVVIGRHVERLRFLDVLLGDQPVLSPSQVFYQRMLAGDPTEALDHAEQFLKERTLITYYDEVALEGLRLAHEDAAAGSLDRDRQATILASIKTLVDDLADVEPNGGAIADPEAAAAIATAGANHLIADACLTPEMLRPEWRGETPILCVGARPLDDAVAHILAHGFAQHGLKSRTIDAEALAAAKPWDATGVALFCLSSFDAASTAHTRFAIRRIRRKTPDARVLVGIWHKREPKTIEDLRKALATDRVVTTLGDALAAAVEMARLPTPSNAGDKAKPRALVLSEP